MYDDGSESFTGHLWSNIKLEADLGVDLATQAASSFTGGWVSPSHLTADEAANQIAQGRGQAGATDAQLAAAEAIENKAGASGVTGTAADRTAATVESTLKWGTGLLLAVAVVGGGFYLWAFVLPKGKGGRR
jgi:hypothetical protein